MYLRCCLPLSPLDGTTTPRNTIKALKAPPRGNSVVWDAGSGSVTGFGVRITAAGSISFVLRYVIDGRERRMTLGKFPDLTIAVARELAAKHRSKVAVEVNAEDALHLKGMVEKALVDGMLRVFPGATTNGLVEVSVGQTWAEK
jgi:hypothetical protein